MQTDDMRAALIDGNIRVRRLFKVISVAVARQSLEPYLQGNASARFRIRSTDGDACRNMKPVIGI